MAKRRLAYTLASAAAVLLASVAVSTLAPAQTRGPTDPGVRGGTAGPTGPIPITGLSTEEQAFFKAATIVFGESETVQDGLGPRFNLDSCGGCHIQPKLGGSSPALNPQVKVATALGAKNTVRSFIKADGPV